MSRSRSKSNARGLRTSKQGRPKQTLWWDWAALEERIVLTVPSISNVSLLADINKIDTNPTDLTPMGSKVFFLSVNNSAGTESLWVSDGTATGTIDLVDFQSQGISYGSSQNPLAVVGNSVFLSANDSTGTPALYASDGTLAGTVKLDTFANPPANVTNVNGTAVFFESNNGSLQLWKSNGTASGTTEVTGITNSDGYAPDEVAVAAGKTFFVESDTNSVGQVWETNGRSTGTTQLTNFASGATVSNLTSLNGGVVFSVASSTGGSQLWDSNGTAGAGTKAITTVSGGLVGNLNLSAVGGEAYFAASTSATNGAQIWETDGTAGGTQPLSNLVSGLSSVSNFTPVGSTIFFTAEGVVPEASPSTTGLWDIVNGAVAPVASSIRWQGAGLGDLTPLNPTTLLFAADGGNGAGTELWKSDGTASGTVMVKDINAGAASSLSVSSSPYSYGYGTAPTSTAFTVVNGVAYFAATDGPGSQELWRSDGTASGTNLVTGGPVSPSGTPQSPELITDVAGMLFFAAHSSSGGNQLWKSDGTSTGTTLLQSLTPVSNASSFPTNHTPVNGLLFFTADDGVDGEQLWVSGGTQSTTKMLTDIPATASSSTYSQQFSQFTTLGNELYFVVLNGDGTSSIFESDGTVTGTAPIYTTATSRISIESLTTSGSRLFFATTDGTNSTLFVSGGSSANTSAVEPWANESVSAIYATPGGPVYVEIGLNGNSSQSLWYSDGTTNGTENLGPLRASITKAVAFGQDLAFLTIDTQQSSSTEALWLANSTVKSVVLLQSFPSTAYGYASEDAMRVVGNTLFFDVDTLDTSTNSIETQLWSSDGTGTGTRVILGADTTTSSVSPSQLTDVNGKLVFFGTDPSTSREALWTTDGTASGTNVLLDLAPGDHVYRTYYGQNASAPLSVLFFAVTNASGTEIWGTDGTATGTVELNPAAPTGAGNFTAVGTTLYFVANDSLGTELWSGQLSAAIPAPTPNPTTTPLPGPTPTPTPTPTIGLVTDINQLDSNPTDLTSVGSLLYFVSTDPVTAANSLWVTNGTPGGAIELGSISNPLSSYSAAATNYAVAGSTVYFLGSNDTLYKTNGTLAGTVPVVVLSSNPTQYAAAGGLLYFTENVSGQEQLIATDGSALGTKVLETFDSNVDAIGAIGSSLYAIVSDYNAGQSTYQLWVSNGTASGTIPVTNFAAGSEIRDPVEVGAELYFVGNDGTHGNQLWKSDGTVSGTVAVTAVSGGYISVIGLQALGSSVYYFGVASTGTGLFESGGTSGGATELASDLNSPSDMLVPVGNSLYFTTSGSSGYEFWEVSGGEASQLNLGVTFATEPGFLTAVNSTTLVFEAESSTGTATELWSTNGTSGGTVELSGVLPTPTSVTELGSVTATNPFTVVAGFAFYSADDGVHGDELWKTNGTTAGTGMVVDLAPGAANSSPRELTAVNGALFFVGHSSANVDQIWDTDGTPSGTVLVQTFSPAQTESSDPSNLNVVGGSVFFTANDGVNGTQLWMSNGNAETTEPVTDFPQGTSVYQSTTNFSDFAVFDGSLYFVYYGPAASGDYESYTLYVSNGTASGTVPLVPSSSGVLSFSTPVVMGNSLYFLTMGNSSTTFQPDVQLWRSDGTPNGTTVVATINVQGLAQGLTVVNGSLLFYVTATTTASPTTELWKSDGTTTGTVDVATLPGVWTAAAALGNDLLFTIPDSDTNSSATGTSLWVSDGTAAGTKVLKDFTAAVSSGPTSAIGDFTVASGKLFFSVHTTSGYELWSTDGSGANIIEIASPSGSLNLETDPFVSMVEFNGSIAYFALDPATNETALWKSDGTTAGTKVLVDLPGVSQGGAASYISLAEVAGNELLFVAPGAPDTLWETDGTTQGTSLLAALPTDVAALTLDGGTLFFTASDSHGDELWAATLTGVSTPTPTPTGTTPSQLAAYQPTPNPVVGLPVTLEGIVTVPGNSSATPTGTVSFVEGGTTLGTEPVVNGVATLVFTPTAAGPESIVLNYSGDSSFAPTTLTVSVSVGQQAATLTLGGLSATYDGNAHLATVTTNPPGLSGVTITYSQNGVTVANPTAAGTYNVSATLDNSIYAAATVAGQLVISPAEATLTLGNLSAGYDGNPQFASVTTSPAGLSGVSITYTLNGVAVSDPTAEGSYAVTATLTNPNYTATPVTGTLVISAATASLTLGNLTATYDGNAHLATVTTNPSGLTGVTITYSQNGTAVANPTQAGSYAVTATLTNADYVASAVTGTLVIGQATATLTLGNLSATYDGTVHPATVTTNPAGLSGVSITYAQGGVAVTNPTSAGSYSVTATLSNANYTATAATGTLVIATGTATLTLGSLSAVYDGTVHLATVTTSPAGLSGVSLVYTQNGVTVANPVAVGSYAVSASLSNANYTAAPVTGTLVIGAASATLTLGNLTATYDGNAHPVTATTNPVGLTGVTITYSQNGTAVTNPTQAGSYTVQAVLSNSNYTVAPVMGTLVIGQATPVLSWANPASIVSGTPLGAGQLDASATFQGSPVAGTYVYSPAAGTMLSAGAGQTLTVRFTPTDAVDFEAVTLSVAITVTQSGTGTQTGPPPPPPPIVPVIIGEKALFTRKLKHGKPTGPQLLEGYELVFNTPLVSGNATNLANYQLGTTKTKKVKKVTTTIFTPISGLSVTYSAATNSVSLIFAGKQTFKTGGRLTVDGLAPAGIESASGGFLPANVVFKISPGGSGIGPG